ncbi:MAG: PEP-CTERM sorting domain-containing protein [Amphiplicatus sp.]
MKRLLACVAGAFVLSATANAATVVLDFEGVPAGAIIANQYPGVVISAINAPINLAITFDSDNYTGEDTDLAQPLTRVGGDIGGGGAAGNLLILSEDGDLADPDDDARGGIFNFDFDDVVSFLGFDGIDINDDSSNLLVRLYGADDVTEIFSFDFDAAIAAIVGDNQYWSLFASVFGPSGVAGVGRAEIQLFGSGAIDNVTFETAEIPAPAALPLLLSGLAGLGFAARRRRKT